MGQTTQVRQIRIQVDTKGSQDLKKVADALGGVNRNTKSLADNVGILKNAFLGYFAALRVADLASVSDQMQLLFDRITVLSGSTDAARQTFSELLQVANRTKASIDDLAGTYARLQLALKGTGADATTVLSIVELLQNSFRLSGSTAAEASGSLIQLSQAFQTGVLRGQELRSVLQGNAVVADLLRQKYGKELYKKAEDGAISTAEVLKLLFSQQERINKQAGQLSQTFGQTLTVSMNKFKFAIREINEEFNLNGKFATAMETMETKLSLIVAVLGTLALVSIPAAVSGIRTLTSAVLAFTAANPLTALFALDAFLAITFVKDLDELIRAFRMLGVEISAFVSNLTRDTEDLRSALGPLSFVAPLFDKISKAAGGYSKSLQNKVEFEEILKANRAIEARLSLERQQEDQQKKQEEFLKKLALSGSKEQKLKEILGEINQEYARGAITAGQYQEKLNSFDVLKLNRNFRDGQIDLEKYNLGLSKLGRERLTQQFAEGAINFRELDNAIKQSHIEDLGTKLKAGSLTLKEYNAELVKLSETLSVGGAFGVALGAYVDSVGTATEALAKGIESTFSSLEDHIFQATKSGKFDFQSFGQVVLDELTKITIRALILRPIMQSILGGISFSSSSASVGPGSVSSIDSRLQPFSKGGIVDSPTAFGYGSGKMGLAGEAGSEAILPLRRGADGKLGVGAANPSPTVVNVHNYSGGEVEVSEKSGPNGEKIIEAIVHNAVKKGIATGAYDRQMRSAFGTKRKGS